MARVYNFSAGPSCLPEEVLNACAAEMNWVIKQEKITLAILAVADKDAQTMCDRLIKAGITGIVNMTRAVLKVPEVIKIENLSGLNALKMIT